jgi:hypothetical protein
MLESARVKNSPLAAQKQMILGQEQTEVCNPLLQLSQNDPSKGRWVSCSSCG